MNDTEDITANWISVAACIQDPKYHVSPNKPEVWLQGFMNAHNVDYVKDSYLESIHFTPGENTDASLKRHLWFLKLQGTTQQ